MPWKQITNGHKKSTLAEVTTKEEDLLNFVFIWSIWVSTVHASEFDTSNFPQGLGNQEFELKRSTLRHTIKGTG